MSRFRSALYTGSVVHRRLRPRLHRLRYSLFYLLLDLDEIDLLSGSLLWFSHNRFNLFSFYDRDHGDGQEGPLRDSIERRLQEAGLDHRGPIRLLTMPRVLGYVFNPLSIFFCHARDGALSAIVYEVNNTFGQRHFYLIPVPPDARLPLRQESRKSLYVSPFLGTEMDYGFSVIPPGQDLAISVVGRDTAGPLIVAHLAAVRRELTNGALTRVFLVYPFLTVKVILGIHWEALLLWLKGLRVQRRPLPPDQPVTVGRGAPSMPTSRQEIANDLP